MIQPNKLTCFLVPRRGLIKTAFGLFLPLWGFGALRLVQTLPWA